MRMQMHRNYMLRFVNYHEMFDGFAAVGGYFLRVKFPVVAVAVCEFFEG